MTEEDRREIEKADALEIPQTLEGMASAANKEHRACERAATSALEHAIRAGELLVSAKAAIDHGGWEGWLEQNFEGTVRIAQMYMKVFRERDKLEKTKRVSDLSLRGALEELADPSRREAFRVPPPPTHLDSEGEKRTVSIRIVSESSEPISAPFKLKRAEEETQNKSHVKNFVVHEPEKPTTMDIPAEAWREAVANAPSKRLGEAYQLVLEVTNLVTRGIREFTPKEATRATMEAPLRIPSPQEVLEDVEEISKWIQEFKEDLGEQTAPGVRPVK